VARGLDVGAPGRNGRKDRDLASRHKCLAVMVSMHRAPGNNTGVQLAVNAVTKPAERRKKTATASL